MKSLRYLCISLILLTITNEAVACWGPWYTPKGYYMYRVYNNLPDPTIDIEKQNPNEGKNCEEWQKLTSETIPLEDIYQVVYKMDLESFEALYDNIEAQNVNVEKMDTEISQLETRINEMSAATEENQVYVDEIANAVELYKNHMKLVIDDTQQVNDLSASMLAISRER